MNVAVAGLLRYGVPLNTAARLLGHRDTRTTSAHYVDVEGADLVAAVGMVPDMGAAAKATVINIPPAKAAAGATSA